MAYLQNAINPDKDTLANDTAAMSDFYITLNRTTP